jgi:hypothetical protein
MAVNTKDLIKYANSGLNVLLSGPHGIGKTAIIKEVFNNAFGEYYKNWRYFSASTLDPWVDFIGIPKNYTRPDGKEVLVLFRLNILLVKKMLKQFSLMKLTVLKKKRLMH